MIAALLIFVVSFGLRAEDWNRFRGPNGSGVAEGGGFPESLDPRAAAWKAPVRAGKSSPILTGNRVLLTAFEEGALFVQCFDRETGKLLWERSEPKTRDEQVNKLNHPAALTPVVWKDRVIAFFKDYGVVAYDLDGKPLWKTPLGPFANSMGIGASPVVVGDAVVVVADQLEGSFIAGIDPANGEIRWKTAREEGEGWASPLEAGGEVLTASRGMLGAHDARSGRRTVTMRGVPPAMVASPVAEGGTLYLFGYGNEDVPDFAARLARLDRDGDGKLSAAEYGDDPFLRSIGRYSGDRDGVITAAEWNDRQQTILGHNGPMAIRLERDRAGKLAPKELWRTKKALNSVIPSPLVYRGLMYIVRNGGILMTLDVKDGKILREERVAGALGGFSASPVAADGKVYLCNEDGSAAVLRAGADWSVMAVHELDEACYATPALSQGQVYVRTQNHLWRFNGQRVGRQP